MEIVVNHVTKTIKNITVIEDVSLTLTSGTIYGLRGVNGSGKTMLMRLIAGLIRPTEGTIAIDGKILGKDISFPPDIGMLIENPAFIAEIKNEKDSEIDDRRFSREIQTLIHCSLPRFILIPLYPFHTVPTRPVVIK